MIFLGKTLTYYGRWTYHIEEAIRQGALGILLIHTNETAGYNWQVVQNSWSGEQLYLQNDLDNSLFFRGWIKEESLQALLAGQKYNLEKLYQLANKKSFKPIPLKLAIKINGHKQQRNFTCNNVIGHLPGKVDKRIVLSAHIDHFGIDRRKDDGDNIFNGAIDNASAVAAMAVCAKLLKNLQKDLYYSVTFLACQVEEAGLLGSKYYVQHTNRENIIANLNFESTPVWGKTNSIMGVGAEYNQFESILRSIAQELNIEYTTSSLVDQGFFYRSDQFPFARYRIPAIWISTGDNDSAASQSYREFWRTRYHTVKDEYDPAWTFEGLRETVHYTLMIIDRLNTEKKPIQWNPSLPFPFEE
jgi:Zn-dependent M28 family amino/carboxypeptidase